MSTTEPTTIERFDLTVGGFTWGYSRIPEPAAERFNEELLAHLAAHPRRP